MIQARFVYMDPPAKLPRQKSSFGASYSRTLQDLERELGHLNAKDITIQAGFRQVRNDGWPYSSARPDHPACVLQFRKGLSPGVLTFRATKFATFEENLRAIAMTLFSLRAVDRYGVVEGEQYAGFKAIPAPEAMTREKAITILQVASGKRNETEPAAMRRHALFNTHPDQGGTAAAFQQVKDALEVCGL